MKWRVIIKKMNNCGKTAKIVLLLIFSLGGLKKFLKALHYIRNMLQSYARMNTDPKGIVHDIISIF